MPLQHPAALGRGGIPPHPPQPLLPGNRSAAPAPRFPPATGVHRAPPGRRKLWGRGALPADLCGPGAGVEPGPAPPPAPAATGARPVAPTAAGAGRPPGSLGRGVPRSVGCRGAGQEPWLLTPLPLAHLPFPGAAWGGAGGAGVLVRCPSPMCTACKAAGGRRGRRGPPAPGLPARAVSCRWSHLPDSKTSCCPALRGCCATPGSPTQGLPGAALSPEAPLPAAAPKSWWPCVPAEASGGFAGGPGEQQLSLLCACPDLL